MVNVRLNNQIQGNQHNSDFGNPLPTEKHILARVRFHINKIKRITPNGSLTKHSIKVGLTSEHGTIKLDIDNQGLWNCHSGM